MGDQNNMTGNNPSQGNPGPAVDTHGNPVLDPTRNVLDLVDAAIRRQDDLREQEARHNREIDQLRWRYDTELRRAESARIDAIRAVDVAAVQGATETARVMADTLRTQVDATATAAATALSGALAPLTKSIADLQRAQYETQGGRTQTGETRLNVGTILQAASFLVGFAIVAMAIYAQ